MIRMSYWYSDLWIASCATSHVFAEFRDNFILSTTTTSGMTFMNSFNLIYYSFSPKVAEYIREQSWLQQRLRVGLYQCLRYCCWQKRLLYYQPWSGKIGTLFA